MKQPKKLHIEVFPDALSVGSAEVFNPRRYEWRDYPDSNTLSLDELLKHIPPKDLISINTTPNYNGHFIITVVWKE